MKRKVIGTVLVLWLAISIKSYSQAFSMGTYLEQTLLSTKAGVGIGMSWEKYGSLRLYFQGSMGVDHLSEYTINNQLERTNLGLIYIRHFKKKFTCIPEQV